MSISSLSTWIQVQTNASNRYQTFAKNPTVKADADYFTKVAPTLTTVDKLMSDRKALGVVLAAYGLQDEINNAGRIRQILTQDPAATTSLANRLADPRFQQLAKDLSFYRGQPNNLKNTAFTGPLVGKYDTTEYELSLAKQDPALREAAYFMRNIGGVSNVYQILSDRVLTDFVKTALGFSDGFYNLSVDQKARLITSKLNLKDLTSAKNQSYANATSDSANITNATTLATTTTGALDSLVSKLQTIQQSYRDLAQRTDPSGQNASLIASESAAIPSLADAFGLLGTADNRLDEASGSVQGLQTLATGTGTAPTDAATLADQKAQFHLLAQRFTTAIDNATYVDPASGATNNLLTDGSFSLTVTLSPGHTQTITGSDLSALKSQIQTADSDFQALNGGDSTAGIAGALGSVASALSTATTANTNQLNSLSQLVGNAGPLVATVATDALTQGNNSANDALTRAQTIALDLSQIQGLAAQAADPSFSGDRTALTQQAQTLQSDIQSKIATPGTAGLDNLLQGPQSYALIGSSSVSIRGADFTQLVSNALGTIDLTSTTSAQALSDSITNTIQPAVYDAQRRLRADQGTVSEILQRVDPRSAVDSQLASYVAGLNIVKATTVGGNSLLSPSAGDLNLQVKSTGDSFTIHAHDDFTSAVLTPLKAVVAQLGTLSNPASALNDVIENASTISTAIKRDVARFGDDATEVTQLTKEKAADDAARAKNPYLGTTLAVKLAQQYIINSGGAAAAQNPLLALFANNGGDGSGTGGLFSLLT